MKNISSSRDISRSDDFGKVGMPVTAPRQYYFGLQTYLARKILLIDQREHHRVDSKFGSQPTPAVDTTSFVMNTTG